MRYPASAHYAALALFPLCSAAAGLGDSLAAFTVLDWAATIGLSVLAGVTSLLQTMHAGDPEKLWLSIASHMTASILAGLLMLFGGEAFGLAGPKSAVAIILASYGGARVLNRAFERWLSSAFPPKGKQ